MEMRTAPLPRSHGTASPFPFKNRSSPSSRSPPSSAASPAPFAPLPSSNSPQPLFLIFSASSSSITDAYAPLLDRWIPFPSTSVLAFYGALLLLSRPSRAFVLSDPFSNLNTTIPPSRPLHGIVDFHPIAFISESLQRFKIVMICAAARLY